MTQYYISSPWRIGRDNSGNINGDNTALLNLGNDFAYSTDPNGTSHYVLEAKLPMDVLGPGFDPGEDTDVWVHWTMQCGNDYLNLKGDINVIPEPLRFFLFSGGLSGFAFLRRRKRGIQTIC